MGPGRGGRGGLKVRAKKGGAVSDDNDRGPKRPSLRLGTGKKGRGAEISSRRGSLRKKDRSAEKAQKAEAALERNTVNLPE